MRDCFTHIVETLHRNAPFVALLAHYMQHTTPIFKYLHLGKLNETLYPETMYLYVNVLTPEPITELFVRIRGMHSNDTRQRSDPV